MIVASESVPQGVEVPLVDRVLSVAHLVVGAHHVRLVQRAAAELQLVDNRRRVRVDPPSVVVHGLRERADGEEAPRVDRDEEADGRERDEVRRLEEIRELLLEDERHLQEQNHHQQQEEDLQPPTARRTTGSEARAVLGGAAGEEEEVALRVHRHELGVGPHAARVREAERDAHGDEVLARGVVQVEVHVDHPRPGRRTPRAAAPPSCSARPSG